MLKCRELNELIPGPLRGLGGRRPRVSAELTQMEASIASYKARFSHYSPGHRWLGLPGDWEFGRLQVSRPAGESRRANRPATLGASARPSPLRREARRATTYQPGAERVRERRPGLRRPRGPSPCRGDTCLIRWQWAAGDGSKSVQSGATWCNSGLMGLWQ